MVKSLKRPGIFYGWWIVGAGFLTLFMTFGTIAYARSVFFRAMFSDLGWSRGDLALAMSIGVILGAITRPFVGAWVDKYGGSRLIAISAFLTGGVLMVLSQIRALWQAFVIFPLLALAQFGITYIPILTTVANWFVEKRGRAIGITMAGVGMGGFVIVPFSTYLISNLGWRMAWAILGLLMWVVVIPPALLVVKQKPELLGLLPDGKTSEDRKLLSETKEVDRNPSRSDKWTLKGMLRIRAFWLIAAVHPLFFFGEVAIIMHSFALFTDKGISAMIVGTMVGFIGLFSLLGKLVLGYLSERIPVRYLVMGSLAVEVVAMFLLLIGPVQIGWLFVGLWGFSQGAVVGLLPILVGSCFNTAIIGRMLGIFMMCTALGSLLGPSFMGYSFDITGNYNLALLVFVGTTILAAVVTFFTRPSRQMASSLT